GRRAPTGRPAGPGRGRARRSAPRPGGGRMNRPLRHVWLAISVLFVLPITSPTSSQGVAKDRLNGPGHTDRTLHTESARQRAPSVVDGHPVAASEAADDTFGHLRACEPGAMYAPVTGYDSGVYGFTGIERSLNDALSGEADALFYHRISDILSGRQGQGATVELTLDSEAQEAAWDALDGRRGAAVALDPETGAVLAMVSAPSF